MQPIGKATLKNEITKSNYFYGSKSEVGGKTFEILEESVDSSSFLCIVEINGQIKGLMDVWKEDIKSFELYANQPDPFQILINLMRSFK